MTIRTLKKKKTVSGAAKASKVKAQFAEYRRLEMVVDNPRAALKTRQKALARLAHIQAVTDSAIKKAGR